MAAKITFCGGAGTVTGANFLLETESARILVDCGLLQREAGVNAANAAPFPYDPSSIDALFVTHAHADHIGRIPFLVREGFSGPIYSTAATRDLSALMFDDALGIMEEESRRGGPTPLYEREDAKRALSLWQGKAYHESVGISDFTAEFLDAGHILGSAMIRFERGGKRLVFTGDIGNSPEPLLRNPENLAGAHYLVIESVYGDRAHEDRAARREYLREAIESVRRSGGTLLIPAFSLERTQVLLYEIGEMVEKGEMRPIAVYLDAPLAIEATKIFRLYRSLFNEEARSRFGEGDGDPFSFPKLALTPGARDSRAIQDAPNPKIIIAGAGMSNGGRIRAHEKRYLGDPHAAVLFVGYQVPGSPGRRIQEGEKRVLLDGENVRVRASIHSLTGYSGHADRDQLLSMVEGAAATLEEAFVVMGEPRASLYLAQRIRDFLGIAARVPKAGESSTVGW